MVDNNRNQTGFGEVPNFARYVRNNCVFWFEKRDI